ncbi:MAG: hypothetical protein FJ202_01710 [Gemmatimonadetes bacterium]|nr:hypothetical protein [Gemmatimonadota bacterium]
MDLRVKTTILLTTEMHDQLTRLAERQHTSLGALVREACAEQYGIGDTGIRVSAVHALGAMSLPVGSVSAMKAESVTPPEKLAP